MTYHENDTSSAAMRVRSLNAARNAEQYLSALAQEQDSDVRPTEQQIRQLVEPAQHWTELSRTYADLAALAQAEEHRYH